MQMHLIYIYSFFLNSVHEILLGIKLLISISITASFKSKLAKNFLSVSHYIISLTDFFYISEVKILDRFQFLLFFFKHFTKFYCTAFVTSPINFILKTKILTKVFSRSSHVIMSMILTFNTQNLFCSHHYKEASMSWYLDCEFINYVRLQTHKNPLHTVF